MYTPKQQKIVKALEIYKKDQAYALMIFQKDFDQEKAKTCIQIAEYEFVLEIESIFAFYKD